MKNMMLLAMVNDHSRMAGYGVTSLQQEKYFPGSSYFKIFVLNCMM